MDIWFFREATAADPPEGAMSKMGREGAVIDFTPFYPIAGSAEPKQRKDGCYFNQMKLVRTKTLQGPFSTMPTNIVCAPIAGPLSGFTVLVSK